MISIYWIVKYWLKAHYQLCLKHLRYTWILILINSYCILIYFNVFTVLHFGLIKRKSHGFPQVQLRSWQPFMDICNFLGSNIEAVCHHFLPRFFLLPLLRYELGTLLVLNYWICTLGFCKYIFYDRWRIYFPNFFVLLCQKFWF